jgi:hypothetical protein
MTDFTVCDRPQTEDPEQSGKSPITSTGKTVLVTPAAGKWISAIEAGRRHHGHEHRTELTEHRARNAERERRETELLVVTRGFVPMQPSSEELHFLEQSVRAC